ncbi:MAG: transporter substrate-binding domain-containing protein [Desulfobacterium sp.]|nr:transporter substrate-binding domain-containing protein [Desulfobacterium sp.]
MKTNNILLLTLGAIFLAIPSQGADKLTFSTVENANNAFVSEKVITEAYQRIGIEIILKKYPARRALRYSNEGITDGELFRIAGMDKEHPNLLMIPVPVHKIDGMVFTKEKVFSVKGWDSLKPYVIGARRGVRYSEKGLHGMNFHLFNNDKKLFKLLDAGRVDIIVITRVDGMTLMRELKTPHIRPLEPPIKTYPLYHYLHKKNKHLVPEITVALQEMEKEGRLGRIRKQLMAERFGNHE